MLPWRTTTPLGRPVVPDVYITSAMSVLSLRHLELGVVAFEHEVVGPQHDLRSRVLEQRVDLTLDESRVQRHRDRAGLVHSGIGHEELEGMFRWNVDGDTIALVHSLCDEPACELVRAGFPLVERHRLVAS